MKDFYTVHKKWNRKWVTSPTYIASLSAVIPHIVFYQTAIFDGRADLLEAQLQRRACEIAREVTSDGKSDSEPLENPTGSLTSVGELLRHAKT